MKQIVTLFAILFSITTNVLCQVQEYQGEQAPDINYDFGEGFTQDPKFKQLLSTITVDNQNNVCVRLATDHNNVRVGDWFQLDQKNPVEESMIKNKNCGPGNVLHGRVDPRVFKSKPVFTFYENYAGPLNLLKKIRNYRNSDNFHYLYEMPSIKEYIHKEHTILAVPKPVPVLRLCYPMIRDPIGSGFIGDTKKPGVSFVNGRCPRGYTDR